MSELDVKIQAALNRIDTLPPTADPSTLQQDIMHAFNVHRRKIMIIAGMKFLAAIILMIFCIFRFFQQTETLEQIAYATVTLMCCITISTIYSFFWLELSQSTLSREIKRLELQVALLAGSLEPKE